MVVIWKELLVKRPEDFEAKSTGTICIELLISKRNGTLYSLIGHQNMIRRFSFKIYHTESVKQLMYLGLKD